MKKNLQKNTAVIIAATSEKLIHASKATEYELFLQYLTSYDGYDDSSVLAMRKDFGTNQITQQKNNSFFKRFFDAFVNPFTLVLLALAIISLITDVLVVSPANRDFTAVIIVTAMVLISGILRFAQESRSGKAAEKLVDMVSITANVKRLSCPKAELPLSDLVVGDIVHLAAGDMIPADMRVLQAKDLFISQASLTGESEPIEKFSSNQKQISNPLELENLVFMGSNVISGSAICIVIEVGDNTFFGTMAHSISEKKVITSFEKGVNSVSWLLIKFMLCMTPIVLFINGFTKGDWLEAFLFALSIAVGLTPEMLPTIVTANLARGAVNMSKKKTVIKNLNSIQNLGAIDVLCTDKTGTLTQNEVVLERHLDIHGNENARVLLHAFLNSYYQTGLKNLMDIAIIEHMKKSQPDVDTDKYTKIDEIPFDFARRRMSVVVSDKSGKTQLITKGALEEMLSISSFVEYDNEIIPLTDAVRDEITATVQKLNDDGMRVIAVAQKTDLPIPTSFSVSDESDMVLMGYIAFLDPPKPNTKETIDILHSYGVDVKVLTGDNEAVTRSVCKLVGIKSDNILLGSDIDDIDFESLCKIVESTNIFAKLSPQQKARIVLALRENGHTVGFLGDGINDAAAMKAADVGISVDTAVDIAKESADVILLEKDLMVLEQGIIEGRRTFGNIIKYIRVTVSSNFGNMLSVLIASIFLPFLPMLPIQILILNLIYDISCISIPWDNVDDDYLKKPRKWDASSIGKFMFFMGPISSIFDIATYAIMAFIICPAVCGGAYGASGVDNVLFMALFNAGWFVESLWSQTLVIHMMRTSKIPFIQSRASMAVTMVTAAAIVVGTVLPYTLLGELIGLAPLPLMYFPYLAGMIAAYMILAAIAKKIYIKKYGELM